MLDHWAQNGPPVYVAVAGYLGMIKPRKSSKPGEKPVGGDLNDLIRLAGPGGMIH